MTADLERMASEGSTSSNRLEKNELGNIPLINKRVSVVGASRVVAGKREENYSYRLYNILFSRRMTRSSAKNH